MKRVKINLMMFAAGIAIFGAVVTKVQNVRAAGDPVYSWFDASGNYDQDNTKAAERTATGCNDATTTLCENAFTSDQLVDPSDPSQGVLANQTPQDHINKRN